MKAHSPLDDMFRQHFTETTMPVSNTEELWSRIALKKKERRNGFLWVGLVALVLCGLIGPHLIDQVSIASSSDSKSITAPSSIKEVQPNNNVNPQFIIASDNQESASITSIDKPQIQSPKVINVVNGNHLPLKSASVAILQNSPVREVVAPASEKQQSSKTDNLSPVPPQNQISSSDKVHNLLIDSESVTSLKLGEMDFKPALNDLSQSDSWSRCEVKAPGHLFVDLYGQGGLPLDKITFSQSGSDQTAYRDLWDQRFDPKASWHGGLQIGYQFRNGLRASGGAEYQELVTQYADNQRITEIIRVWDPQAYFTIDNNGDRVWVGDTVTAINIYDQKFVKKNKHTLVHIPVQLGYDIYSRPGFHIGLEIGAAFNISKSYAGQYIRSDLTLIEVDENNQDSYISKDIGVSLSAGLHFGYYQNDHLEFYLSPRFRYNPNSYLLDTETLKITRNILALRGGIRYHF